MTIKTELLSNNKILLIKMDDKFDFAKVKEFKDAYADIPNSVEIIDVDLQDTQYMDSSALGMLLNMQKVLSDRNLTYRIINCRSQVARILQISRFDKKFEIQ